MKGLEFIIKTLEKIGYNGWVNIIEPKQNGIDSMEIAKRYCEKFRKLF